ncbi:MAG: phosphoglycerate kinase [Chlamydiae bacterium RIFCSPHIGHO2_12_FULL_49_9]|nr:MAG: phosphoglycerate kinase [Chlamydiae bacterium RIFCSPHIGHO2_12_FULL_49_9]
MTKLTIEDLPLKGRRVLMRVDFNVPLSKEKTITDDSRIAAALPSIQYALKEGASLVLMSHLGRPNGKPNSAFSLSVCAKRLSELLNKPVLMAPDCVGPDVEKMASRLKPGEILMLENLRFHEGEEFPEKDPKFVKELASLGDVYINDAFGTAHRAHSSTALIAKYFPERAAAGFLMSQEISHLSPLLENPERPFYAIIGGAKISTKIGVMRNLLRVVDALFIGGGMTFTFLKSQGIPIGGSLCEDEELKTAAELLKAYPKKIHLALDLVVADAFSNDAKKKTIPVEQGIPTGCLGMDIGSKTVEEWSHFLKNAATVFWNGPLGVFEMPNFAIGTQKIAEMLAASRAQTIIGGGDSVAAIHQMGLADRFAHLSTGGGASMEFLEFGHLPGIDALSDKK